MQNILVKSIIAIGIFLIGCGSSNDAYARPKYWIEKGTCLPTFVGPYSKGQIHKAFFATADLEIVRHNETQYACGGAVGYPTKQSAIIEAEKRCKHAQAKRHAQGTCKLIDAM